jgi:hypothetical protein
MVEVKSSKPKQRIVVLLLSKASVYRSIGYVVKSYSVQKHREEGGGAAISSNENCVSFSFICKICREVGGWGGGGAVSFIPSLRVDQESGN